MSMDISNSAPDQFTVRVFLLLLVSRLFHNDLLIITPLSCYRSAIIISNRLSRMTECVKLNTTHSYTLLILLFPALIY